ncbi:MAG: hypothetical protein H0X25_09030 [Acidobacteriales bacterium]|nr:hypothetical protein [Terriglobales bacterium]
MRKAIMSAFLAVGLLTVSGGMLLRAQEGPAAGLASGVAENSAKLKQYTFKQKVEVYMKGELRKTSVSQVRYDSTRQRVATPIASPDEEASARGGGRRGGMLARRVAEKKEEMKDYIERMIGLMGQYLPPNADKIKSDISRAEFSMPESGEAKVTIPNYLKQGDSLSMTFNREEKRLSTININSKLDDDPITVAVNFQRLPNQGPNYPAMTNVNSPAKNIELRISTYDYQKQ